MHLQGSSLTLFRAFILKKSYDQLLPASNGKQIEPSGPAVRSRDPPLPR